jgi:hypothetical protein
VDGHALFVITPEGDFEDVRADEEVDLRDRAAHRRLGQGRNLEPAGPTGRKKGRRTMSPPARKVRMVRMVGDAEYRDQAEATLSQPGDASLVLRGRPRAIVMACPDGCGETLVVNLDGRG